MSDDQTSLRAELLRAAMKSTDNMFDALAAAQAAFRWVATGSAVPLLPAPSGANGAAAQKQEITIAARDAAVGECWAFKEHRTQAEVNGGARAPGAVIEPAAPAPAPPAKHKRRGKIDMARLRALLDEGKSKIAIAVALGVSESGVYQALQRLGADAAPKPRPMTLSMAPASFVKTTISGTVEEIESMQVVVRWLKSRDVDVKPSGAKHWLCGRNTYDRAELLTYANVKRALINQPPFAYVGPTE